MLKNRLKAANQVATRLQEAETAVDMAIVKLGELVTVLPKLQEAANLSPVVGNDVYNNLGAAVASMYNGRASVVAVHHALEDVRVGMGLRHFQIVGTGDAAKILKPEGRNDDGGLELAKSAVA